MLRDGQRCAPNDFTALHAIMHNLGVLQRPDFSDEREDVPARDQIASLKDFASGHIMASEQVLFIVEHGHRRCLERLPSAAERNEAAAAAKRLNTGFKRRGCGYVIDNDRGRSHCSSISIRRL